VHPDPLKIHDQVPEVEKFLKKQEFGELTAFAYDAGWTYIM